MCQSPFYDNVNRKYKDSVFTLLFTDKERLLELYNAINGTNFTDKDGIQINTLQNALFMGRVNDISSILDNGSTLRVELRSLLRNRSAVVSANSRPKRVTRLLSRSADRKDNDSATGVRLVQAGLPQYATPPAAVHSADL